MTLHLLRFGLQLTQHYIGSLDAVMNVASGLANEARNSLTRQRILQAKSSSETEWVFRSPEYKLWLSSRGPNMLWISGPPNNGKTQALVEVLDEICSKPSCRGSELIPVVYFCCKEPRNPDNLPADLNLDSYSDLRYGNVTLLRSVIAQILMANIQRAASFRRTVIKSSREQASVKFLAFVTGSGSIDSCFEHLWELFRHALEFLNPEYVFLDGLDKLDERTTLLRKLFSYLQPSKSGPQTKLLVTARPYADIQRDLADVPVIDETSERKRKQGCVARWSHANRVIDCLNSLYFTEYQSRRNRVADVQTGTAEWIWNHPSYRAWCDDGYGILWLQGKPGSGKSTLVKQIQKQLSAKQAFNCSKSAAKSPENNIQSEYTPVIAHFFYNIRGGIEETRHYNMLRSLLYQILKQEARFYPAYRNVFREIRNLSDGAIDWSYAHLNSVFDSLAELRLRKDTDMFSKQIILIIDAMDESEAGIHQIEMLSLIHKLCSHSQHSIQAIISSRPVPEMEESFRQCHKIILQRENSSDIEKIIELSLDVISNLVQDDSDESDDTLSVASYSSTIETTNQSIYAEIQDYLMEHSQGVILWIVLILGELEKFAGNDGVTPWKVRQKLRSLPDGLEAIYREIIKRLKAQEKLDVDQGCQMLNWATFAKRPLSLEEFRDALAVTMNPKSPPFYSDEKLLNNHRIVSFESLARCINNNCGGFLEIQRLNPSKIEPGRKDIIQLIHQTVREFLMKPDSGASPYNVETQSGTSIISGCCIRYLKLSLPMGKGDRYSANVETWVGKDYKKFVKLLKDRPLLLYTLSFLPDHLKDLTSDGYMRDLIQFLEARSLEHNSFAWFFVSQWVKCLPLRVKHQSNTDSESSAMANFKATCLIFAAKKGFTSVVQSLIEAGASVDRISGVSELSNISALDVAAKFGRVGVVEVMVAHTTWPQKGISALKEAASKDNAQLLSLLLASGATADARDPDNLSALHVAVAYSAINAAKVLINAGADIEARDDLESGGLTPLHWAAIWGSKEMVATLLKFGANINADDRRECTPLHWATNFCRCGKLSGRPGGSQYYLSTRSGVDWSPRHHFAQHQQEIIAMAKFLIDHGAMVNAVDSNGATPLHYLAFRKSQDTEIASFLIKSGALVEARDNSGLTPIHMAAEAGNLEMMCTLLEEFSNAWDEADAKQRQDQLAARGILTTSQKLHVEDKKGQKPIHIAASAGQVAIIAKILDLSSDDLEILDNDGESALYKAVIAQNPKMIRFLLSHKARKPLIHSFLQHEDFFDILNLLIQEGWDVDQLDEEGNTALYLAFQIDPGRRVDEDSNNHHQGPRTLEAFLTAGADPDIRSSRGRTVLHEAAKSGSTLWVRKLIEADVDIDTRDDCGRTPLHDAAETGQESIARLLLINGADRALRDAWDQTALQDSIRSGHPVTSRALLENPPQPYDSLVEARSHDQEYLSLLDKYCFLGPVSQDHSIEDIDRKLYGKRALLQIRAEKQLLELAYPYCDFR